MDRNSDIKSNIIGFIVNSDKDDCMWREIEMHYIINSVELWIPCICEADTRNMNLHNIQQPQWQTEPDLTAAPASVLEIAEAVVAPIIKSPVPGPRAAAAAAAMIKTLVPVAMGLTPMEMSDSGTNLGGIMAVTRARNASRWMIAMMMTMMMNHDPHFTDCTYSIAVVVLPVWTTKEG